MGWKERVGAALLLGLIINTVAAIAIQWHIPSKVCPSCTGTGSTSWAGGTCGPHPPPDYRCPQCRHAWNDYSRGRRTLAARMLGIDAESWWEPQPVPFFPWHHESWTWSFRKP